MLEKCTYEEYFQQWSNHIAKLDDTGHEWLKIEYESIRIPEKSEGKITFFCPTNCFIAKGRTSNIPTGYKLDGKPCILEITATENECLAPGDVLGTVSL